MTAYWSWRIRSCFIYTHTLAIDWHHSLERMDFFAHELRSTTESKKGAKINCKSNKPQKGNGSVIHVTCSKRGRTQERTFTRQYLPNDERRRGERKRSTKKNWEKKMLLFPCVGLSHSFLLLAVHSISFLRTFRWLFVYSFRLQWAKDKKQTQLVILPFQRNLFTMW